MNKEILQKQLENIVEKTDFRIGEKKEICDWDIYTTDNKIFNIATDRVTSHDRTIGTIPFKGQCTAAASSFFIAQNIIPTNIISKPHPQLIITKNVENFQLSFVIQGYLRGSAFEQYKKGVKNFFGHNLPANLEENQEYPEPIVIPILNNKPISKEMILAEGLVDEDLFEEAVETSIKLFSDKKEELSKQKLFLVKAKYFFGIEDNKLVLLHNIFSDFIVWNNNKQEVSATVIEHWLNEVGFEGNGPAPPIPDEIRIKAALEYIDVAKDIVGRKLKLVEGDQLDNIIKEIKVL